MTQTEHLGLNIMEGPDYFCRDHWNENTEKLDAAVAARAQMVLLWENASPDSDFAAQEIDVAFSDYDSVVITCDRGAAAVVTADADSATLTSTWPTSSGSVSLACRWIGVDTVNSKLSIWDSRKIGIGNASCSIANGDNIPLRIYGIKGVSV